LSAIVEALRDSARIFLRARNGRRFNLFNEPRSRSDARETQTREDRARGVRSRVNALFRFARCSVTSIYLYGEVLASDTTSARDYRRRIGNAESVAGAQAAGRENEKYESHQREK